MTVNPQGFLVCVCIEEDELTPESIQVTDCGQIFYQVILQHVPPMMYAHRHYDLYASSSHGGEQESVRAVASKLVVFIALP